MSSPCATARSIDEPMCRIASSEIASVSAFRPTNTGSKFDQSAGRAREA